jgi:protein TonB
MKFDFSPTALDGPVTKIDVFNGSVLDPGEWCTRREDCAIAPGPTGRGGVAERSEITTGSELVARIVGAPARPRYPESLRAAGLGGRVLVQFTVDTAGRVDPQAVRVLESTHDLFARAVLEVLPRYRFVPAEANGRRVRMVAQMPFEFTIAK